MKDTTTTEKTPRLKRHLKSIFHLLHSLKTPPKFGAEIGVWKGETSAAICKEFPECHMLMVDTWKSWKPGDVYYEKHVVMGRLGQEEWDKVFLEALSNATNSGGKFTFSNMTGQEAAVNVEEESLDFVYLDANHMYEEVLQDIRTWTPKVRKGGFVIGHDYGGIADTKGLWGITKATHEVFGNRVQVHGGLVWSVVKE